MVENTNQKRGKRKREFGEDWGVTSWCHGRRRVQLTWAWLSDGTEACAPQVQNAVQHQKREYIQDNAEQTVDAKEVQK